MSQSFLVVQTAFLGDAILSTAVLEKLHEKFPGEPIDILVRKGNESIFENHPFIRNVLTWNKKEDKYKNLFGLIKKIRATKYDQVINLQRFGASGLLTIFSNAREKSGFNKNPFSFMFSHVVKHKVAAGVHETDRNQALIDRLAPGQAARPRLYPQPKHFDSVSRLKSQPYITISPASVWYTKSFPDYKWIEFIQYINSKKKYTIYLLGAPGEFEYCETIIRKSKEKNLINLSGKLSVLESAALMKDADMNYVNDSAPLHIASSMNAPVTVFYCSTVPEFGFGPLSDNSHVVQTPLALPCKPCGLHGYKECPLVHFKCGRSILINDTLLP